MDLNHRRSALQADALPTGLRQHGGLTENRTPNNGVTSQHYSRLTMSPRMAPEGGFGPPTS